METNSSEINLGTDTQRSSTAVKVELSEYDNAVPFKVIKLEPDSVLPQGPVWVTHCVDQDPYYKNNSGSSKLLPSVSLNHGSTSFCDVNMLKQRHDFENDISSDESSSESDIELDNDTDSDSRSEYCVLSENKNESDPDVHDVAVWDDEIKNIQDRPPTLEWTSDKTSIKKLEFTKKQELRIPRPQTPYEALRWFLNDEIVDTIVQETNKYAASVCKSKPEINTWKDVTREEIMTFLALLIHTGTFRTNSLEDYWKTDYLFNWMCFSKFMKRDRFLMIFKFLNFATPTDTRDIIGHIRPIIKNFNTKMSEIYYPGKELFLANTMVLWRGRLVRQGQRKMNPKVVVNLYMLAEPNGAVIKYQVYSNNNKTNILRPTTGEIVKELLEDYLGNGHAVYMNRCYSSWILATKLLGWQTYCTGILNRNSRDNLFTDKTSDLPKQGNQSFYLNGVHIGKWNDRKSILYISTEFDDEIEEVVDGTTIAKPKAITNYIKYMTDSALQDQLMSFYPSRRKSLRWNQRMFIHSMQIYMNNAYHLFNTYSGKEKLSFYDFRVAVLKAMLPEPQTITVKLAKAHVLTKIKERLSRDNKRYKIVRKKCVLCIQKQKSTNTIFECLACDDAPGFCTTCFCEFHSSKTTSNHTN